MDNEIKETEITPCIPAQAYLDHNYPKNGTYISKQGLESSLDLSDFTNLEELSNQLTTLDLSNLEQLESLYCSDNCLTQMPYIPNPEQLVSLTISNNNFPSQDLSIFSQFRNLEWLEIGKDEREMIKQGIYNRFTFAGSLKSLKNLTKLKGLNISNTDINSGVEYLPDSLERIYYNTNDRSTCKLGEYKGQIDKYF
ncbi:26309_t:CDS:2 [Racocetra persica]|uniref:26309_t:CDS:1 n=1 Tax=Racocetra persica TaxID=160502 RepID=A0ACA9QRT8_9GLOM|nr:26309_t:CDS:2 [Racocetra persica]